MGLAMEETADPGRAAWLRERKKGLGGTDAAAILGFSKWATPLSVWLDKRGEAPPDEGDDGKEWLWWGRHLEEIIARRYMERTGRKVYNPERILYHAEHPCLLASPDRLALEEPRGLDIKTARRGDEWGPPGSDEIPMVYVAQMAHYMAVADLPTWDVAVLIGGSDFRVYTLRRDMDLEREMVPRLVAWWERHIVGGERPEIDGSESTRKWLSSRFPQHFGDVLPAPPECDDMIRELADARASLADFEERKAALENRIKLLIGEAAGFQGQGWRVTWKLSRGRQVVDWQATANSLAERLAWATAGEGEMSEGEALLEKERIIRTEAEKFTEQAAGSRRFLLTLQDSKK